MSAFRIEGDYIVFDYRKIARLLPNLSLGDLRAAEQALTDFEPDPTAIKEAVDHRRWRWRQP